MFGWLFNGLISLITYPFFIAGWYLLVYLPLAIIAFFNFIFNQIGINIIVNAIFNQQSFSFSSLPIGFWIFAILSISLGFIIFVLRYLKFLVIRKRSADAEIISMGKTGIAAFAFIFLFPIIFFILLVIIQSTLLLINRYIRGDQNLIGLLLKSATNKIPTEELNAISISFSAPSFSTFSGFESGEGLTLIITLSASSIVIAYILGISFISWFTASAQLFMNFLTMPVWAINSIWDDGKRLKSWTKTFFGQFAIIIVYQASFNLFLIWIASTHRIADSIDFGIAQNQQIFRFLFKIAFIIGGGLAISTFTRQIAAQYGQEGAVEHHQRLASSTLKVGGVALAGATSVMSKQSKNKLGNGMAIENLVAKNGPGQNPFSIVDNSIAPGAKSNWRNPVIGSAALPLGLMGGVAAFKFGKAAIEKWRKKRAEKKGRMPEKSDEKSELINKKEQNSDEKIANKAKKDSDSSKEIDSKTTKKDSESNQKDPSLVSAIIPEGLLEEQPNLLGKSDEIPSFNIENSPDLGNNSVENKDETNENLNFLDGALGEKVKISKKTAKKGKANVEKSEKNEEEKIEKTKKDSEKDEKKTEKTPKKIEAEKENSNGLKSESLDLKVTKNDIKKVEKIQEKVGKTENQSSKSEVKEKSELKTEKITKKSNAEAEKENSNGLKSESLDLKVTKNDIKKAENKEKSDEITK
ncbi:Mbov_0396 family ICE element transmembrane protein [Mycoplasma sp. 'Moose RK']|uniref:Mbov_0396 family ICE element transmembrane protein n=1 Tax=Mycoplasma sp. 'Moose RK' TaxID=2780095 RepID=UPI0018C1FB5B|nr:hypothetical protein [Mycoplasma sp. 'Moose RK']MBG0730580.1 hypothetical protein [Mycoplasma sp. 'Moose RK']